MTVIHSVSPKVNHLKGKGENYILGKMDFMRMEWEGRRKKKTCRNVSFIFCTAPVSSY